MKDYLKSAGLYFCTGLGIALVLILAGFLIHKLFPDREECNICGETLKIENTLGCPTCYATVCKECSKEYRINTLDYEDYGYENGYESGYSDGIIEGYCDGYVDCLNGEESYYNITEEATD